MLNAREDRQNLGMSITEYQKMAEALSNHSYLNKHGDMVKIWKTKSKKLKNLRHRILKNEKFKNSPIFMELIRLINVQLAKKEKRPIL